MSRDAVENYIFDYQYYRNEDVGRMQHSFIDSKG